MVEVNLGAIRFNWRGAYAGGTAYVADDVVSSGGSSYICILASTGNAVSNATYWSQMSQAGTDGTDGTDIGTTITTQGDILYRDGSGLQRLAKGTAAQVLTVNSGATAPEWTTPAGGLESFSAKGTTNQSLAYNTHTALLFPTEIFDTAGKYDTSTSKWTPSAGKILLFAQIYMAWNTVVDEKGVGVKFYSSASIGNLAATSHYNLTYWQRYVQAMAIVEANGTDTFWVVGNNGDSSASRNTQATDCYFSGVQLS